MYCTKCGAQINEDAKFCSKCGNATSDSANTEHFYSAPANPYATQSTPEPVQNPYAQPVYASARPSEAPVKNTKPNPFAFVSAGIMTVMLVLHFLPWFFVGDGMADVFSYYIGRLPLEYPEDTANILFLVFMLVALGFLIAGIIVAIIRKNHVPVIFAIASSVAIQVYAIFFIFTKEAWTIGVSFVPLLIYLITFINIPFAILAKKR